MKKGIVFDLDGTLWDVSKVTYDSVNQVAKNHNLKEVTMDTIHSVFGLTKKESVKKYFPAIEEVDKSLKLGDEVSDILISNLFEFGGNVYNGLEETLKTLSKEYNLFIVSNTGKREYIEAFFNCSNLKKYFVDYYAASALNITKAEAIKKVVSNYNLEKCIYVGDTQMDLEATKVANVPFVYAKYGFGHNVNAKYSIENIKELPDIVKSVK